MTKSTKPVAWNAADYAANSASQLAWACEIVGKLRLRGDERILDVGCGDGKITAELAGAVPRGAVVGVDSSSGMIRFARAKFRGKVFANLRFRIMDARRIRFSQPFDLIISNAALHWVDDHPAFLRGAATSLHPGGRLVISCGGKGNAQDVFVALRGVMRLKRWRQFFRRLEKPYFFHGTAEYEKWLPRFGFKSCRVQLVPKESVHASAGDFTGWLRTTWMPYTHRVPENLREEFIHAVAERYLMKHPPDVNGYVRVRMVRLEIDAIRETLPPPR